MRRKFDLNLLPVFLEVFRLNSITQAADTLDTTQPAVSSSLKRLSQQLGETLFIRDGRGIAPTSAAVHLAREVQPLMNQMESTLENMSQFDIQQPRLFSVFVTEPMLLMLQPMLRNDPNMGQCNIEFILAPAEPEQMFDELSRQQVDLAIIVGQINNHSFAIKPVHQDKMLLTCAHDHPRVQQRISLAQYYEEVHVGIKMSRSGQHEINRLSKGRLDERKVWVRCDSIVSGLALASKTDILCLSTAAIAHEYASLFNLQVLDTPFDTRPVVHNMVWHKRTDKSQAHQWLRNKIEAHLASI